MSRSLSPGERAPGTHFIAGWVGPRAGLDNVEYRKKSFRCRESSPGHPDHRPSLYRLGYPVLIVVVLVLPVVAAVSPTVALQTLKGQCH
jgi:hypothetical protein